MRPRRRLTLASPLPRDRAAADSEMFDAYHVQLVRIARFLCEDEETAEQLVMERFATPYRRWAAIREPEEACRCVRSCVRNGAADTASRARGFPPPMTFET